MKNKRVLRMMALAAALTSLMCLLPGLSMADGAPKLEDPSVTWLTEEVELLSSNVMKAGQQAVLYIPVVNHGTAAATSPVCTLPYSSDPQVFPFEGTADVVAAAYKKYDPAGNAGKGALVDWDGAKLGMGERAWFMMSGVKALASLKQGSLDLVFKVDCLEASAQVTTDVYVSNSSWKPSGGSSFKSKPKVIIESYSFDSDHIYAGDTVRVNICVRNTSSSEAITNLQFDFADEAGMILPASGGSNSVFLGEIKADESYQMVLFLNVAPDAEAKTYSLGIKLVYEGTKNRAEFTEETSIALAVLQRIRVRLTEPAIYGDPWVGQGVSMGVSLYNLSKATIYNCAAEVEGEGLSLEEPFFGGNVAAGGTMRADLSVISEFAGEVKGKILITYEDVYGEATTEEVEFTMFVNEMTPDAGMTDMTVGEPEEAAAKGMAWYWWLIIGLAVAAGATALIVLQRKKRKKFLEEL